MAQWVLSVAGIAILSVLADIILPVGQTRKYIKTVIGVVVTLVLAQPIFSLAKQDLFHAESHSVEPQEQYIEYVTNAMDDGDREKLQAALQKAGFQNPEVVLEVKTKTYRVTFCEQYTAERYRKAVAAAESVKCKYFVSYRWNNSE